VVVLTEVLFGASTAWQSPINSSSSSSSSGGSEAGDFKQQAELTADSGYETVLLQVLSAATQPKLWGLPTSQAGAVADVTAGGDQAGRQQLPAQVGLLA
jgi:hypothetical protein